MIIDTHHHLWNYNPIEFDWIDEEMAAIQKSFLPNELEQALDASDVSGVVTVQARQIMEETDWLLSLAAENDFMKGVVGWLPLSDPNIESLLDNYSNNQSLKGVRHVVQGEPNPEFILGKAFNNGISKLFNYNLVYDILIFEHQLPNTIKFVDQHPNQIFVVDHIAKPRIKANELEPWASNIRELAKRPNVYCKISGMVTEADFNGWTHEQLQPYFDTVIAAFGPKRLMIGSDWPVCLVAVDYKNWIDLVLRQISSFSSDEQELIKSKNAELVYKI